LNFKAISENKGVSNRNSSHLVSGGTESSPIGSEKCEDISFNGKAMQAYKTKPTIIIVENLTSSAVVDKEISITNT
jgi:hypothetical protein